MNVIIDILSCLQFVRIASTKDLATPVDYEGSWISRFCLEYSTQKEVNSYLSAYIASQQKHRR